MPRRVLWLLIRVQIALKRWSRAEHHLATLIREQPQPQALWLYLVVLDHSDVALSTRLAAYRQAVTHDPTSARAGDAWRQIGQMEEQLENGIAAVAAYRQAESLGMLVPELDRYYSGNWEAIPGFAMHPDAAHPTVCSIDLEVNPAKKVAPHERIFEMGATRFRGQTLLARYHATIARSWRPSAADDQPVATVVAAFTDFLGDDYVTGHNVRAFDAPQLRTLTITIANDRMVDTLELAHLLAPESPRHDLATLCVAFGIDLAHWHHAGHDAEAAARLSLALGDALIRLPAGVLTGIRALVPPGSAFDTIWLTPRGYPADPHLNWTLDPHSGRPLIFPDRRGNAPSMTMRQTLASERDALVEIDDVDGAYVHALPSVTRTVVVVEHRQRLDRMLATVTGASVYVIPEPRTLLCPTRVRAQIAACPNPWQQLMLFCLYQASHNHDAARLWIWHSPDPAQAQLRATLAAACCPDDPTHREQCPGWEATTIALARHALLLSTYRAFFALPVSPVADLLSLDDASTLPGALPHLLAHQITSDDFRAIPGAVAQRFVAAVGEALAADDPPARFHQRIALGAAAPWLIPLLDTLAAAEGRAATLTERIGAWAAGDRPTTDKAPAIGFLDMWYSAAGTVERWSIGCLEVDPLATFQQRCWEPYHRHVLCDRSLTLGAAGAEFLALTLGLPTDLPCLRDPRPPTTVFITTPEQIPASAWLRRRAYGLGVGAILASMVVGPAQHILLELDDPLITAALTQAWRQTRPAPDRLWLTAAQIPPARLARYLATETRPLVAVMPASLRRDRLEQPVDVVISGPLRFASQRDPLVAAMQEAFLTRYPDREGFRDYLLPLALFELKRRLTHPAGSHIVLDGRITRRAYQEVVREALADVSQVQVLPTPDAPASWMAALSEALSTHGLPTHQPVAMSALRHLLRTIWGARDFRALAGLPLTQGDLIQTTLAGLDQLIVIPTGGGKSLCYQLPAIALADDEPAQVTLVISPLIALMQNQVMELRRKGIVDAVALTSALSSAQRIDTLRGIRQGRYSLIFAAPEQITSRSLRQALQEREIGLVALDEAHAVSQWGHDFRPDYSRIRDWLTQHFQPGGQRPFPIIALTTTARQRNAAETTSTVDDIIERLGLDLGPHQERLIMTSPRHPELDFRLVPVFVRLTCPQCRREVIVADGTPVCTQCQDPKRFTHDMVNDAVDQAKEPLLIHLLTDPDGLGGRWRTEHLRGLIYCAYTSTVRDVAARLRRHIPDLRVGEYYGKLDTAIKSDVLQRIMGDGAASFDVVVCTNAFGMGIDLRKLAFVIHWDLPASLEAYYQEAGRAGRDSLFHQGGEKATCILLYHPADLGKQRWLQQTTPLTEAHVQAIYTYLVTHAQADDMGAFALVNDHHLANQVGIAEDQVAMALYYLEAYTTSGGQHVARQGERVQHLRWLRLSPNYQAARQRLPQSPALRACADYAIAQLEQQSPRLMIMSDLAFHLKWSLSRVERALGELQKRQVLVLEPQHRIQWLVSPAAAQEFLERLQHDIQHFFTVVDGARRRQAAWRAGKSVTVDLMKATKVLKSNIDLSGLVLILQGFTRASGAPPLARMREHKYQVGAYELRANPSVAIADAVAIWCTSLTTAITRLTTIGVTTHPVPIDLTTLVAGSTARRDLMAAIQWLDLLGLLRFDGAGDWDFARYIRLLQPSVSVTELACDLTSLRQKEAHDSAKLDQMRRYAEEATDTERQTWFADYFAATQPLIQAGATTQTAWMTSEQRAVIALSPAPHSIVAPAGSGKTRTLVSVVRHLVVYEHLAPERLLVITHFQGGVARLAELLQREVPEAGNALQPQTMNAFANSIVQRFWQQLALPLGDAMFAKLPRLDHAAWEQREGDNVGESLRRWHHGEWTIPVASWPEHLPVPEREPSYRPSRLVEEAIRDAITRLREAGIFPGNGVDVDTITTVVEGRSAGRISPALVYVIWLQLLVWQGEYGCYGFADQILFALAILRQHPDIAAVYRTFYQAIIVDEFQDLTPGAADLLHAIAGEQHTFVAFGDPEQDIVPRRSGSANAAEAFQAWDTCGPHLLTSNFRATQPILDLTIQVRNRDLPPAQRLPSMLALSGLTGPRPVVVIVPPGMTDADAITFQTHQAIQIAAAWQRDGVRSIALVVATKRLVTPVEAQLAREEVPFSRLGRSAWQLPYIHPIVCYLRLVATRSDDDVRWWLRRGLVPYVTTSQLIALERVARERAQTLWEVVGTIDEMHTLSLPLEQVAAIQRQYPQLDHFSQAASMTEVLALLATFPDGPLGATGDDETKASERDTALDQVRRLTVAAALHAIDQTSLTIPPATDAPSLLLTTVDAIKSLEITAVILIGLDELKQRRRLYVALSRAQQYLALLGRDMGLLNGIPPALYDKQAPLTSESKASGEQIAQE